MWLWSGTPPKSCFTSGVNSAPRVALLMMVNACVACGDDSDGATPGGGSTSGAGTAGSSGAGSGAASGGGSSGGGNVGGSGGSEGEPLPPLGDLVINEVMSRNEGAWIDEQGEADDWLELVNRSERTLELGDYGLQDAGGIRVELPARSLEPGQSVLVWVDSDPSQGELHLPFKIAAEGERLVLTDRDLVEVDWAEVPALEVNQVYARFPSGQGPLRACRYATPGSDNGATCAPAAAPQVLDDVVFEDFEFPEPFPSPPAGLALNELALRPSGGAGAFLELINNGATPVALDAVRVRVAPHAPSSPWPGGADGSSVALPAGVSVPPGGVVSVAVPVGALNELALDPAFEGVVTLFNAAGTSVLDRVDFMQWPAGASLARDTSAPALFRYCTNTTAGAQNSCDVLSSRDVGERLRHLRTPGDFAALSEGAQQLGIQSTKFVVDLEAPGLVHLLSSARWPLHYTFVRERVYLEPELDRCDPAENAEFYDGWSDFSVSEYYSTTNRRFHLGTLSRHGGADLSAVEYTFGDAITGEQMRDAFLTVMPHTDDPARWVIRPQDAEQVEKVRAIEGRAPLVGPNAPFAGVTYQPLTEGLAYGTLRFVPAGELLTTSLGSTVIVITDDVPNDIPLVGGLITEAFQTPLAHVNVLSQNRGTPNAGLAGARTALAPYLDQLVKLAVTPGGIDVELADAAEAEAFWASQAPSGDPVSPRIDTTVRGIQDLTLHDLDSLPIVGAKAAQMAELLEVADEQQNCPGGSQFIVPLAPFAIPLAHYREHFAASGAEAKLSELEGTPGFASDPALRAEGLAQVRQLILGHPVEPALLAEVEAAVLARFGQERVRFRSSSNTEDLPSFNGAGLYTSISAELGDPERLVADAMRTVWASLWNARAYDERAFARIVRDNLAMGILVHPATLSEQGNGVSVSRNVLNPTRGDQYYINAQVGEASVTNPAPAVSTEQLVYQVDREPPLMYQSQSSLLRALPTPPPNVLTLAEVRSVGCALGAVHEHFRPLLDPGEENRWFAMELEFKLVGPDRQLHVKQARPHSFGAAEIIADCREL